MTSFFPSHRGYRLPALLGLLCLLAAAGPGAALGYRHHDSRIDYQEYSQAAFDRAGREDKPVFLLLTARWCYWCKLYAERTLESEPVAEFLNRNFINVFVDVDQRQDLDHLYANRGVPTSVIFTPRGRRFISFSGTLTEQEFLEGVGEVLERMKRESRPGRAERQPSVRDVREFLAPLPGKANQGEGAEAPAAIQTRKHGELMALVGELNDESHGGMGQGRKLPLGPLLLYLLRSQARGEAPPAASVQAEPVLPGALAAIARALHDPVEGGFFRYADRNDWSGLRYEKMLVTNANLILAFKLASLQPPSAAQPAVQPAVQPEYGEISRKSLQYLLGTLYNRAGGGFFNSQDGKNPAYYRLAKAGRAQAVKPEVERTIHTAANGEVIHLLAQLQRLEPTPRLRAVLLKSLEFLLNKLRNGQGGFYNNFDLKNKIASGEGLLLDNAWGALALVTGLELTGDPLYREAFRRVMDYIRARFLIPESGAYRLWNIPRGAGIRDGERISNEVPLAANGVLALALVKAHRATGNESYLLEARNLTGILSGLEPELFQDDPDDVGKKFLAGFVYYLEAMRLLAQTDS